MGQIIIHVDMDAFYASVEMRDDPSLRGKPLIIGSLPNERGVVATCSYEARRYGVHSAMNIKEAYRLCPGGIYMHPDFEKYKAVSAQLRGIWDSFASASETIALDEAYLDVTAAAGSFEKACEFARDIKRRTREELGLTCSVGIAYSKTAAKTASEEKKPDGYFEIPDERAFVSLISDRDVRVLYTVGAKTAEKLGRIGIHTVRELRDRKAEVINMLGRHGEWLVNIASGKDDRKVMPYRPEDARTISREITFQADVSDYELLGDVLLLIALCVDERAKRYRLKGSGVSLKLTYTDMKSITRQKRTSDCGDAYLICLEARKLLSALPERPVRLIGAGIYGISASGEDQLTFDELINGAADRHEAELAAELDITGKRYMLDLRSNVSKLSRHDTLHKTAEYMRKHKV